MGARGGAEASTGGGGRVPARSRMPMASASNGHSRMNTQRPAPVRNAPGQCRNDFLIQMLLWSLK